MIRWDDVTVCVPTHGRSTYPHCLMSVERQSVKPAEVLVIKNLKLVDVYKEIFKKCRTTYFVKCDDDFLLHPEALRFMRRCAQAWFTPRVIMLWWHLWDLRQGRVIQSIKLLHTASARAVGFRCDHLGLGDPLFLKDSRRRGYTIHSFPHVLAVHGSGSTEEQIAYRKVWQSQAADSKNSRFDPANIQGTDIPIGEQLASAPRLVDAANKLRGLSLDDAVR